MCIQRWNQCDGGVKLGELDIDIELLAIALECYEVCGRVLRDVDLFNQGLQAIIMSLKR